MLDPAGSFTYTPAPDFNGGDRFTYAANDGFLDSNVATVSLTVTAVDDAPVAQDQSAVIDQRTVLLGTLVASDVDSASLTFSVVTAAAYGALVVDANGTFSYTPGQHFHGVDGFTFRANDGTLDSNLATVTITVQDVTPPALTLPPDQVFEATSAAGAVVHYTGVVALRRLAAGDVGVLVAERLALPARADDGARDGDATAAGNTSEGDFVVLVVDTTPPLLSVPSRSGGRGDLGGGRAGGVSRRDGDRCGRAGVDHLFAGVRVRCSRWGRRTCRVTAKDAAGNATAGSFDVVVVDTTAPVLSLPGMQTAEATSGAGTVVTLSRRDGDRCGAVSSESRTRRPAGRRSRWGRPM